MADAQLLLLWLAEELALAEAQKVGLAVPLILRVKVKDTVGVEAAEDTSALLEPLKLEEELLLSLLLPEEL